MDIRKFYEGFYSLNLENSLIQIKNDNLIMELDEEFPYDDARTFLYGGCDLFAIALSHKFGYECYEIRSGASVHCFCKVEIDGSVVFIDVRGMTNDFYRFLDDTYINPQEFTIEKMLIRDVDICNNEWNKEGYMFAQKIIEENLDFYDVSKLFE